MLAHAKIKALHKRKFDEAISLEKKPVQVKLEPQEKTQSSVVSFISEESYVFVYRHNLGILSRHNNLINFILKLII